MDFDEREHFITDGSNDEGIDGYFISKEDRMIYFIQAKFRTNEKNLKKKTGLNEILLMDTNEFSEGPTENEDEII